MILYGDLTFDSRVRREARTLALAGSEVTVFCLADQSDHADLPDNVTVVVRPARDKSVTPGSVNPFRAASRSRVAAVLRGIAWLRDYVGELRAWGRAAVATQAVDIWHLNDLTGLAAVAPFVDRGTPMVYDVHDLQLHTGTAARLPSPMLRLLGRYERYLVSRVAAIMTVNDGYADVIRGRFPDKRTVIVHNCPDRWVRPEGAGTLFHDSLAIPSEAPVILYHGLLSLGRGIEELMDAVLQPGLETAHLVLLGFGRQRDALLASAAQPRRSGRVHVVDAVPPSALLSWVMSADVGAVVHPGPNINDRRKTPNKLFECLAAGVPVVASDFPLMRRIIVDHPTGSLGALADPEQPASIALALRSILELDPIKAKALRQRCVDAAQTMWNWETESAGMVLLYDDLAPIHQV